MKKCNGPPTSADPSYSSCVIAGTPTYSQLALRNGGDAGQARSPSTVCYFMASHMAIFPLRSRQALLTYRVEAGQAAHMCLVAATGMCRGISRGSPQQQNLPDLQTTRKIQFFDKKCRQELSIILTLQAQETASLTPKFL